MGLDSCMKCIKYTLFIFNFFFWLVGVGILAVGLYLLIKPIADHRQVLGAELDPFYSVRLTLIVVGSIIMLLGFLGCCGSILENKCMLLTFFILMTLVFIALVVVGLLTVFLRNTASEHATKSFEEQYNNLLINYKNVSNSVKAVDAVNVMFSCCGVQGDQDFTKHGIAVPESCKDHTRDGCKKQLEKMIEEKWMTAVIVIFSIASVTLIGMVLSMLLCCALRDEYDY